MSSFEGLSHLADHHHHHHHRFGSLSLMHRRSDSVESHGSISSLSSNQSSINGGNGGNSVVTPSAEISRFRRCEPLRSPNSGCATKNPSHVYHHVVPRELKVKSSRPSTVLLHSTSVMESPGGLQTLNRSKSGSCPIVWEADASMHEHPKQRHLQSSFVAPSTPARGSQPAEQSLYGQMTGSVQYAGSQHDDCRALGGSKMMQNSGASTPDRQAGDLSGERRRAIERCPTENSLSDFVPSPGTVVSSLQRSLSTASVGAVPNSSFTSKLNCSLSRLYTNKLDSVSCGSAERINELKKPGGRIIRPNFFQTKLPSSMEMGIDYNVKKSGPFRQQRNDFEKDSAKKDPKDSTKKDPKDSAKRDPKDSAKRDPKDSAKKDPKDSAKKDPCSSPKIVPFGNRGNFKHRSFENINSASSRRTHSTAHTPNENNSNGHLHCITPVENRFTKRQNNPAPKEDNRGGFSGAFAPRDAKPRGRLLPPTPAAELSRDTYADSINSEDFELDEAPVTPSPDKIWNWSPLKPLNISQSNRRVGGSLTSLRSVVIAPISDDELDPRPPERVSDVALMPKAKEKSTYVSEMFVNIAKPRPTSVSAKQSSDNPMTPGNRTLTSSTSSYDLPANANPKCNLKARSSLPSAVSAANGTRGNDNSPSVTSAAARNKQHSKSTEKTAEVSPDVRTQVLSQKECFYGLLKGINDLYQYRENLRTYVAQLETEMQERRQTVDGLAAPSAFDLEKLYKSNVQLKFNVKQLSGDVELARCRASQRHVNGGDGSAWSCTACTFINHPALSACKCCEIPRPTFVMR